MVRTVSFTIEPLAASEFGLWFIHKGIPSFGQNSETEHLSSLITQTDQLLAQLQAGGVAQTANLMPAIRQQLEQIRSLQTMLFERIGELDSGSDPLTNLLNRRFLAHRRIPGKAARIFRKKYS